MHDRLALKHRKSRQRPVLAGAEGVRGSNNGVTLKDLCKAKYPMCL